jgi:hypothetical protein
MLGTEKEKGRLPLTSQSWLLLSPNIILHIDGSYKGLIQLGIVIRIHNTHSWEAKSGWFP